MHCASEVHAKGLWDTWWAQVQESGIKPLKEFARKSESYLHGILASAKALSAQHLHIGRDKEQQDKS
ncbi:transposase [Vibrio chagasii]|nr:transposase [Vibrio chagasii]